MRHLKRIPTGELRPASWGRAGLIVKTLEYVEMVSCGVVAGGIQDLKGLMSRKPIGRKRGSDG